MASRAPSQRLLSFSLRTTSVLVAITAILLATALPAPAVTNAAPAAPSLSITKTVLQPVNQVAYVGDTVLYAITLTNTGATTLTTVPLADTFDPTKLAFTGATLNGVAVPPTLQYTGVISWTNLTLVPGAGNLVPGASLTVQTAFKALAVTTPGTSLSPTVTQAQIPARAPLALTDQPTTPNDYYDLETRFIIDKAIDQVNGGVYLAVKGDGTPWDLIPERIYGFQPRSLLGTYKHPGGQGICVEYFLREYQRLSDTGGSIATQNHGVLRAADMLPWAKQCADFVDNHMIIGTHQNEPSIPVACVPGIGNRCLYYWGFVNAAGTGGYLPSSGAGVRGYNAPDTLYLSDSFVAWSIAELALTLQSIGDPSYVTYKQHAYDFWNWAKRVGAPYMPLTNGPTSPPNYMSRDRFLPNLGITLYELTLAEGNADNAARTEALDCVNKRNDYAKAIEMRNRCNGTSYTTAYGRAGAYAMEVDNRGVDNYIGGDSVWHDYGSNHYIDNPNTPQNPTIPFAHGGGREFVAGTQRSHWFYYTFPDQPDPSTLLSNLNKAQGSNWSIESWSRNAILDYWKYSLTYMWDSTPGQQSWWDSQLEKYKPCFSLGTPVPMADWKAPIIGNKVHTLQADGSALVTVSGVYDPDWPYLNWRFRGIGVEQVNVYYSIDNGATWQKLAATETAPGSTNYVATIPPQPDKTVFYYAEAADAFGNKSTFPAGAPGVYQIYSLTNSTYNTAWSAGGSDEHGTPTPPTQGGITVQIVPPGTTAITLARFEARARSEQTLIQWQTSSERDTYGFKLYRSSTADKASVTLLTPTLIPGHGRGSSSGATYQFEDSSILPGTTYYWLEELDLDGSSTWYGPVTPALQSVTNRVLLPVVRR